MYEKESCAGGVFSVVTFFPSLFRRKTPLHIHQMKCIAQVTLHCYKQRFQDKCLMVHLFFWHQCSCFCQFCVHCLYFMFVEISFKHHSQLCMLKFHLEENFLSPCIHAFPFSQRLYLLLLGNFTFHSSCIVLVIGILGQPVKSLSQILLSKLLLLGWTPLSRLWFCPLTSCSILSSSVLVLLVYQ